MRRAQLPGVIALGITTMLAAAGESPAAALATSLPLLPAPQMPQPSATTQVHSLSEQTRTPRPRAEQALLTRFPEVASGPQQAGLFFAALLLSPDGQVLRSTGALWPQGQLSPRGDSGWRPWPVTGAVSSNIHLPRGTALQGKVLAIDVALSYLTVPAGFTDARSEVQVQDAVLARHSDLLLPARGKMINWLRVQMNEDGSLARHHVELFDGTAGMSLESRLGPPAYARQADHFKVLGLSDQELGTMGMIFVEALAEGTPPTLLAPRSSATSGTPSEAVMVTRASPEVHALLVSYVWPRRADEPAGGAGGQGMEPLPYNAPLVDQAAVEAIVKHYFPGVVTDPATPQMQRKAWVLLSRRGEVLRTGIATLADTVAQTRSGGTFRISRSVTYADIQGEVPGITIGRPSVSTSVPVDGGKLDVALMWLAADSPLPSPGNEPRR